MRKLLNHVVIMRKMLRFLFISYQRMNLIVLVKLIYFNFYMDKIGNNRYRIFDPRSVDAVLQDSSIMINDELKLIFRTCPDIQKRKVHIRLIIMIIFCLNVGTRANMLTLETEFVCQ